MKRNLILFIILFLFVSIFIINNSKEPKNKGETLQPTHYKGVAITLVDSKNTDIWYDETLPKINDLGAGLEVVTAVTVRDKNDPIPVNDPNIKNKLNRLFTKSKQFNVPVTMIKPHIMLPNFNDTFNRGTYNPSNIDVFFHEWKKIINYYASISDQNNVPILSITCETSILTDKKYISYWEEIVKDIKKKYPDLKITMAYTKNELDRDTWYQESHIKSVSTLLDVLSFNMYPQVKRAVKDRENPIVTNPGVYNYMESIQKASSQFKKDILIAETGATPRSDKSKSYIDPFAHVHDPSIPNDYIDQNEWMRQVLGVLTKMEEVKGVYIWHVNTPFNFLDSPTAKTVKEIFSQY